MRITRGIRALFPVLWAAALVTACAGSGSGSPNFVVSFDPTMPRSARDQAVRVEVYLVDSCGGVTLGARPVPAIASTFVLRDGETGSLGALEAGDYGLYGVAQDEECAVVAAGCQTVTVADTEDTLAITLSSIEGEGCPVDQVCSVQTGDCVDGAGGAGGFGGMGGFSGVGGSGGSNGRVEAGLILLYAFDEGGGSTVTDQSGVTPSHDLTIADLGNVTWSANHLTIDSATTLSTSGAATKVFSRAVASEELTVEAWVKPASLVPAGTPPDRIITMSTNASNRNFLLGQDATAYAARLRADGESSNNGNPTVVTTAGSATTLLTHVVFTHNSDGSEAIYIDGVENVTFTRMGGLTTWDNTYPIVVGDEATSGRSWLGELHLIAVYDRALDAGEVEQNFMAGP